jgi:Recombinase
LGKYYVSYQVVGVGSAHRRGVLTKQRKAVTAYVASRGEIIKEFRDLRTTGSIGRKLLTEALDYSERAGATLLIVGLKTLEFPINLRSLLEKSQVPCVALLKSDRNLEPFDLSTKHKGEARNRKPRADKQVSSEREDGVPKRGNPNMRLVQSLGVQAAADRLEKNRTTAADDIASLRKQGLSIRAIARTLNNSGIPSLRGGAWSASSVHTILRNYRGGCSREFRFVAEIARWERLRWNDD